MFRIRAFSMVVLLLAASGLTFAQDGPPPGPPPGRPPLVECVEGEDVPCIQIVADINDIVGVWRRYVLGTMAFQTYNEDGTHAIAFDLQADPTIAGTVVFEDGLALFAAREGSPSPPECFAPGTYEVRLVRVGEQPVALTFFLIDDGCPGRIEGFNEPMLYYTGAEIAELVPDVDPLAQSLVPCPDEMDDDMEAYPCDVIVTSPEDVAGVWKQYMGNPNFVTEGGMGFIRYLEDGSYFLAATPESTTAIYENFPYGSISFNEAVVTITVDSQVPPGSGCETAEHYLRVIRLGDQPVALRYTAVVDACIPRRGDMGQALIWIDE